MKHAIPIQSMDVLTETSGQYERIQRLKAQIINAVPHLCMQRAKVITEYDKSHKHLPLMEWKAKSFMEILARISVYILPDELIVGHQSSMHRSAPVFPEFAVQWIADEIDMFETRVQDPFVIDPEDKRLFLEEIYPYWKGRTLSDKIDYLMPEETRLQRFDAGAFSLGIHETGAFGHVLPDFQKLMDVGLNGIVEECEQAKRGLKNWVVEDMKKAMFYDACIVICEAFILFAKRYSELAAKMAADEQDGKRQQELEAISAVCARVPGYPPRTLHEALQSAWFYQLCIQIYENAVAQSMGRIDQIFYPYYEKDINEGVISREDAQELLSAFFAKFAEPVKAYCKADCEIHAGFPMGQNVCVGGIGINGLDATNDLSYRFLEANRQLKLGQPNFTARVHANSPDEYLKSVTRTIMKGNGMPQLASDDVFIPSLLEIGVPLKEARDYGIIGCIEAATTNAWGRTNGGYFNIAKYVELALSNGKCMISGVQVGPKTGDPRQFASFDDVMQAYKTQLEYGFNLLAAWNNEIDMIHERNHPTPIISLLVGGCLDNGKDVTAGGATYNWTGPLGVGVADTGNSLYAVKYAVFDKKAVTMDELVTALEDNFEGHGDLMLYLKNRVPKYGNDIEEVDDVTRVAMDIFFDAMLPYETPRGGPFVASLLPVASYVSFGYATGALPDGHRSGEPLSDGISPTNGTDVEGPTAVFKSVTKIDHVRCPNGVIFNQKFTPTVVDSEEGLDKFVGLIRSYISLGGGHAQFNFVTSDTLRKAQEHPDEYKGLVVRVAGYSAIFSELSKDVQDTIISRTEQM